MSTNLLDSVKTGTSWNPKLACGLTLALVFLCGGVVGAIVTDFGVFHKHAAPFDTAQGKAAYFATMKKELSLTSEQSEMMESILNDFWQYYRTVLSDGKQRIEQVLTPEQRVKFERMMQEQRR
jgi:Spy/CpxP family protein refolding chaperone